LIAQNNIKLLSIRNNLTALIAFTLPLNKNLIPLLIILSLVIWLTEGGFKEKIQKIKNPYFILSISFYLLHVLGLLYTSNMKSGNFDLEQKLSFLLFPILFLSISIPQIEVSKITKSFIYGCFFACLICYGNACYKYSITQESDIFFYSAFSAIMHSSYFAMYLCFAIILILFRDKMLHNKLQRIGVLLLFSLTIILLSSKSGLISLAFIALCKIIYDVKVNKKFGRALSSIIVILLALTVIYRLFPKSFERLNEMKGSLASNGKEFNTTSSRIAIWKNALHIISENILIGVGTGDVKDALKQEYEKQGESQLVEKQLNAHNQYLQTFIALGLPGLLILLGVLIAIINFTYLSKIWDGFLLTSIIAINLLFESMLETQAGVVFIAYFLMLYLAISYNNIQTKKTIIAP
jgi:O-antigen ligase